VGVALLALNALSPNAAVDQAAAEDAPSR
jgi:hypothetical protein